MRLWVGKLPAKIFIKKYVIFAFRFERSTEEEELTQAQNLSAEATQCWSQLVAYVAATSSTTTSSGSNTNSPQLPRPVMCSCDLETVRLVHYLFNQSDFISYPERVLASTRHLLASALMATSPDDAKRRYDQAIAGLSKTALRLRRAESKLVRRAWAVIQRGMMGGSGSNITGPVCALSQLGDDAKQWSDLWSSALNRVNSVVNEKLYQLLSEKETELRCKVSFPLGFLLLCS